MKEFKTKLYHKNMTPISIELALALRHDNLFDNYSKYVIILKLLKFSNLFKMCLFNQNYN